MLTTANFTDLIGKINKGTTERRNDIQEALIFAACIAQRDRNTDPVIRLFAVIGNETNRKAISHWLSINAPIYFKDEMPKLADRKQREYDGTMEELEAWLRKQPEWFKHATKTNVADNVWDSNEFAESIAKYLEKAAKKAESNGDPTLAALVKDAEMLLRVKLNTEYDLVEAK